jgi:glyoxylase-like metal-dependent hydrolase (beta-lactamase superfamily II)
MDKDKDCQVVIGLEVVEGVHQVDGVNANVYVLKNGEELIVVDAGMPRNAGKILSYVRKLGEQPSSISTILLTHCHIDHAGSAYELRKATNAKVAIHAEDADFLAGKRAMPVPKWGVVGSFFGAAFWFFVRFHTFQPDITLKEGDIVAGLKVIHTPGHTPGSISLIEPKRKLIFVGDTLFYSGAKISVNPKLLTVDVDQLKLSVKKLSELEFETMLSGHGEPLKPKASERVKEFYASLK